jgi:hypothetical protein
VKNKATTNKATLPGFVSDDDDYAKHCHARNMSTEKEETARKVLMAYDARAHKADVTGYGDGLPAVISAKWYMGRSQAASIVYCSVWIRTRAGRRLSGRGSAGGAGYHKGSAAFAEALDSAGITLSRDIHGAGDSEVEDAMAAIAEAAGYGRCPWRII